MTLYTSDAKTSDLLSPWAIGSVERERELIDRSRDHLHGLPSFQEVQRHPMIIQQHESVRSRGHEACMRQHHWLRRGISDRDGPQDDIAAAPQIVTCTRPRHLSLS